MNRSNFDIGIKFIDYGNNKDFIKNPFRYLNLEFIYNYYDTHDEENIIFN